MPYLMNVLPRHLLLFLIVFTPLAFASVHAWAYTSVALLTLILVAIWVVKTILNPNGIQWVGTPVYVLMFLFSSYIFLQTIPVSDRIAQFVSPKQSEIRQRLDAVLEAKEPTHGPFSLNPHRSKVELIKLLTYFGIFLFIINNIRTRKQINQIIIAIICMGAFESLYGMAQKASGAHKILWWNNIFGSDRISGTFINPDHLAGFLEMIILLNIGYVISLGQRKRRRHREKRTWRQILSEFLSREQVYNRQVLLIYPMAIMFIGLFLTASRGALIALAAGLFVITLLAMRQLRLRTTFALIALISLSVFAFGAGLEERTVTGISERYQTLFTSEIIGEARFDIYASLKPLVGDFPVVGTGWGTFSDIYPKYQPKTLSLFFTNAHSDWLELLVETGAVGLTLVVIMMFLYFYRFIRLWVARKDPYAIGIGLGVLGSSVAIVTHSFMDFNLHIPANAFLFAVILGIGFAAIHNQKRHGNETTLALSKNFKLSFLLRWSLVGVAVFGFFCFGRQVIHHFLAETNCRTEINSTLKFDRAPSIGNIKQALDYEPDNPDCMVKLIPIYRENKKLQLARRSRKFYTEENIKILEQALRLNPVRARYYLLLGREYLALSVFDMRNREKLINQVVESYNNAAYFNPRQIEQLDER